MKILKTIGQALLTSVVGFVVLDAIDAEVWIRPFLLLTLLLFAGKIVYLRLRLSNSNSNSSEVGG